MRKFLAVTGSLLLTAALAAGAWWAWPILFPALPSGWLSTLARADADLLQNRADLARAVLEPAPSALPVGGWLQWEKRVQRVAEQTGAWKWAAATAAGAANQYPGNPDLAAFLVWALLQDHRSAEAATLADKVLKKTPWDSLRIQAGIEAAGLATGDWKDLRERLADPGNSAVWDQLVTLATDQNQPQADAQQFLRRDALLASLADGRMDSAAEHLDALPPTLRDKPPFDRLQALMAYDQGDFGRAAAMLKALPQQQPETLLVLADVYLHLGDPVQARVIYDQMLADQPDQVPLSLAVNRATLALDDGQPDLAVSVLDRVTQTVDKSGRAQIELLKLEARYRGGDKDAVLAQLDQISASQGDTPLAIDAELLKGRLEPEWASVPELWSQLHRHPELSPLAERLSWLLLAQQDYAGAHRALDLHEAALKKASEDAPWWALFLRGLIYAAENKLPEASQALNSVPTPWRDATFWADWALVASVQAMQTAGDRNSFLDDALDRLTKALDALPPADSPEQLKRRSLWLTRRGEVQTALVPLTAKADQGALRDAATRDFTQAVKLDSGNLRAAFLLRQSALTQDKS